MTTHSRIQYGWIGALLAAVALAGCGSASSSSSSSSKTTARASASSSSTTTASTVALPPAVAELPAAEHPKPSSSPAAQGRTLQQLAQTVKSTG